MLLIDQSPIGRTPALQPDHLHQGVRRDPRAVRRAAAGSSSGSTPPPPSRSTCPAGRCEQCEGAGHVQVEMVFLADVFVPCEACGGTRYRRDVLDVRIQGNSIHDVLQWTVEEAIGRFRHQPKLGTALWHLQQVGLGYLRLGQPATTLWRRRGAAAQDRARAGTGGQAGRPEALHPRRADDRPAPRRRAGADPGARPPGGRGAHGGGHRAPPRRDQAGRLGGRPRPGGRAGRRAGRRAGDARGGRRPSPSRTPAATCGALLPSVPAALAG